MDPQLASLMDDLGLAALVDGFIATVHYSPDLNRLPRFVDPARLSSPRVMFPAPEEVMVSLGAVEMHRRYASMALRFASPGRLPEDIPFFDGDGRVHATLYRPLPPARALGSVVLAHGGFLGVQPGGGDLRPYQRWITGLVQEGLQVVLYELPRHLSRTPDGHFSGQRFLSGDLLETIDVLCMAVTELEALIAWLRDSGHGPVGLVGMSLGGLTSVNLLSVCEGLDAAILLAPVPDAPRSLFESPIGRSIRQDWQAGGATRADLEAVFAPLSPKVRRPLLSSSAIRLVGGRQDDVVLLDEVLTMGHQWSAEVWEAASGHLGLINDAKVRHEGLKWLKERLR